VKACLIAVRHAGIDLSDEKNYETGGHPPPRRLTMLRNILRRQVRLQAENENDAALSAPPAQGVSLSNVRALATGAALAAAVDSSPAVLVGIYDYAHRYRDRGRRSA
jgi:hypothetical protein